MRKLLLSIPLALFLTAAVAPAAHANPGIDQCDQGGVQVQLPPVAFPENSCLYLT